MKNRAALLALKALPAATARYASEYPATLVRTLRHPSVAAGAAAGAAQLAFAGTQIASGRIGGTLNLASFVGLSLCVGTSINSIVQYQSGGPDAVTVCLVTLLAWLTFATLAHGSARLLAGNAGYLTTLAVSLRILGAVYVVSTLATLSLSSAARLPSLQRWVESEILGAALRQPQRLYFALHGLLAFVYLPLGLSPTHGFERGRRLVLGFLTPVVSVVGVVLIAAVGPPDFSRAGLSLPPRLPESLRFGALRSSSVAAWGAGVDAKIPLSAEQLPRIREALRRIADTVATHRYDAGPWMAGQQIVALHGMAEVPMPWTASAILAELDPRCHCWRKSTLKLSKDPHNAGTAWALHGLARLGHPLPAEVLEYVLSTQSLSGAWGLILRASDSDRWTPIQDESVESTYITSLVTLALLDLRRRTLIPADKQAATLDAIDRGALWINRKREHSRSSWKDFPNDDAAIVSAALSGMALHALFVVYREQLPKLRDILTPNDMQKLGRGWLDTLPRSLPALYETERKSEVFVDPPNFDSVNDVFQTSTPWLLVGTADAFALSNAETRTELATWLNDVLAALPLDEAALSRVYAWQASEAVIGLRYLLGDSVF